MCLGARSLRAGALELFDRASSAGDGFVIVLSPLLDQAEVDQARAQLFRASDSLGQGETSPRRLGRRVQLVDVPVGQAEDAETENEGAQIVLGFGETLRFDPVLECLLVAPETGLHSCELR